MKNIGKICWKVPKSIYSNYHTGGHYNFDGDGKIVGVSEDIDYLYEQLERRLDLSVVPYPKTDEFYSLLRLVFRPEDIPIITHVKMAPTEVSDVAKRVGISLEEADERCKEMAFRGVLSWFELNGHELVILPEYVVGWYEFTLIYASLPGMLEEIEEFTGEKFDDLNRIMGNYLRMYSPTCDLRKGRLGSVTSVLRSTPWKIDETLKPKMEVQTYETMKGVIENSKRISVVNCACKFHETERRKETLPDNIPLDSCYQLDMASEAVTRLGLGREVSKEECLEQIASFVESGHMFNLENNKDAMFLCCCHKDYCGVRKVFKDNGFYPSHRSGFVPIFIEENCIGCSACVDRCPVDVLQMVDEIEDKEDEADTKKKKKKKVKMVDSYGGETGLDVCVGCLNCYYGCKFDAIDFQRREESEVYDVPEDVIEFTVRMAYERGKVHTIIFDDPQSKVQDVLRTIAKAIECNPVAEVIKKNELFSKSFIKIASKVGRRDFLKSVGLTEDDL